MPTDPLLRRARRLRDRMSRVCEQAQRDYRQAVLEAYEATHIRTHEIADALGINRQTVYDLVKRAKENHVQSPPEPEE